MFGGTFSQFRTTADFNGLGRDVPRVSGGLALGTDVDSFADDEGAGDNGSFVAIRCQNIHCFRICGPWWNRDPDRIFPQAPGLLQFSGHPAKR